MTLAFLTSILPDRSGFFHRALVPIRDYSPGYPRAHGLAPTVGHHLGHVSLPARPYLSIYSPPPSLLQYFVQFGCSYIDGVASFRIPWGLQLIPGLILSAGMSWFPESPRWLMDHDRYDEALEVLSDVHGHGDPNAELVQLEYNEIRMSVEFERTEGAKQWSDLFRPGIFRRVFLGTSLQMWSQLTGMK
jgi:hypothetical protein